VKSTELLKTRKTNKKAPVLLSSDVLKHGLEDFNYVTKPQPKAV
jgi:hypothetical protein